MHARGDSGAGIRHATAGPVVVDAFPTWDGCVGAPGAVTARGAAYASAAVVAVRRFVSGFPRAVDRGLPRRAARCAGGRREHAAAAGPRCALCADGRTYGDGYVRW